MTEYLWPWQSKVFIEYPLIMPLLLVILAIPLSIITWIRRKHNRGGS